MNKYKIIFIPDSYYLSNPVYLNLASEKDSKYEYIYFDLDIPSNNSIESNDQIAEIQKVFDKYIRLSHPYKQFFFSSDIFGQVKEQAD